MLNTPICGCYEGGSGTVCGRKEKRGNVAVRHGHYDVKSAEKRTLMSLLGVEAHSTARSTSRNVEWYEPN